MLLWLMIQQNILERKGDKKATVNSHAHKECDKVTKSLENASPQTDANRSRKLE